MEDGFCEFFTECEAGTPVPALRRRFGPQLGRLHTSEWSWMHYAAYTGRVDVMDWLHSAGVPVDAPDDCNCAPLSCARRLVVGRWLHARGADPHRVSTLGWSLLHQAAYFGATDVLVWLLRDVRVRPGTHTTAGQTPASVCSGDVAARVVLAAHGDLVPEDASADDPADTGSVNVVMQVRCRGCPACMF